MATAGAIRDLLGAAHARFAEAGRSRARSAAVWAALPEARSAAGLVPASIARFWPLLQTAASLLWIPQAALLSLAVSDIAAGNDADMVARAGAILMLGLAKAVLDGFGNRLAFQNARLSLSEHRACTVEALATRSPLDPDRPPSGLAASILTEQAEATVPYLARFRPARLRATIVPAAILLCVLAYSWAAALVLLVAAPLIPVFMALVGWRAKAASEEQLVELGSMNAFLLDRLRGLVTIRSLRAVDATARRVGADAESLRVRTMAVLRIAFLSSAVLELFAALGVAMVAVYVGFHLLGQLPFGTWGETLSLGEGLFILLLAPAFFEPLRELSAVWHDRAAGEAALGALAGIARGGRELAGTRDGQPASPALQATAPSVRIENLRFRHAPHKAPILDGFDLDVAAGEHVALLAPSGAGKSTLLALMAGLAVPENGRIIVAGQPLAGNNAAALRRRMAWIGQHPHIFPGPLAGNVTMGRADIDPTSVRAALRLAGLETVAARRGTAPIGEGGVGLSGGEASRLALARVAATPDAGLILADEPTAHLDTATAEAIAHALIALARGRTLIVVTHDPALAARMDRIVRLAPAVSEGAA